MELDPAIKAAFETFGDVVANADGGSEHRPDAPTSRSAATACSRSRPAASSTTRPASSPVSAPSRTRAAGTDYNFFPFPDIDPQFPGAVEGAGDLFGMFHDTAAAKSLMKYLVTAEAQDIWVKIGGALSANKNATSYPGRHRASDPPSS